MREMGAPQERIDLELARYDSDDDFEVLPENWPVLEWFLQVDDLFIYNGHVCMGLDILAIKADAEMQGKTVNPDHYIGLRQLGRYATNEIQKAMSKA